MDIEKIIELKNKEREKTWRDRTIITVIIFSLLLSGKFSKEEIKGEYIFPEKQIEEVQGFKTPVSSIILENILNEKEKRKKILTLERYLTDFVGKDNHKSPLIGYEEHIVEISEKYELDYKLIPAIARKESRMGTDGGEGKTGRPFRPYNAWGLMTKHSFNNWEHGIEEAGRILSEVYFEQGLDTVEKIAPKYCPPDHEDWAKDVKQFMYDIKEYEEK